MTQSPKVSIVVPAYREGENIAPLTERIFAATLAAGLEAELIIVDDDSQDGTEEAVEALRSRFPIRLIVRRGERGLSGAVLRGFSEAKSDRFVVLDADLQHPPETIPAMVAPLDGGSCDFVIGTRYAGSGGIASDWPLGRKLASKLATLAARPLAHVSDPMSGFFALRRETWQRAEKLDPVGYKIALELIVKCRCRRIEEVPIDFAARVAGESKASLKEGLRYGQHLWRLYWFRFRGWITALFITAVVGIGWLVGR